MKLKVRNTIIRVAKIKRFLGSEMTKEDMKQIQLPKQTLVRLKSDSNALGRASLNTIAIIDEYIREQDEQKKLSRNKHKELKAKSKAITHIGIDLGSKNFLSASDKDMIKTFTTDNHKIGDALHRYGKQCKASHLSKRAIKSIRKEFDLILNKNMDKIINELINIYGNNMTYVIGNPTPSDQSDNIHEYDIKNFSMIIYKRFNKRLNKYKNKHNIKVVNIDECYSSITCPKCDSVSKTNRTSTSNRFECISCGFHHHTNDEVASCNIVKRYLNNKQGGE